MKICLGILARNEAARIGNLIRDLERQSLLANDDVSSELHVIANGCTDATAELAQTLFRASAVAKGRITRSVHELPEAGKSHAWNVFVHDIVPLDTDYVFLLDADLRIPDVEALQRMLHRLSVSERAVVAVGGSISDLAARRPRTLAEWLIKAGTGKRTDPQNALSGAFYCARYAELAKVWMPIGLPVENGFLRAMLMTSRFCEEERLERLVFVEGADHIFESERTIRALFRHNVRLTIGTALNVLLFKHLRALAAEGVDLALYVRDRNLRDPTWVNNVVEEELKSSPSYFIVHTSALLARIRRFRKLRLIGQLRGIPMLCIGIAFDIALYCRANVLMRRGQTAGFW